ncbi:hypothetical protein [Pseudomonas sp.]|uniref:hypothetical protein n=1 Tax=Pseudomonas sp. TaxID=306 RepID=UPI003A96FCB4
MSILNVFIKPEEGLIGVDSEAVFPDGYIDEQGKLIVAPAANAVVGFRGNSRVLDMACPSIYCFGGEVERMAEGMPGLIKAAIDSARKNYQVQEHDLGLNLVIVGYSQAERSVVGHLFRRDVGSEDIRVDRIQSRFMAPYWGAEHVPPGLPDNRDGLCMLARSQSSMAREQEPGFAAGGRYFIASVKRRSISIVQAFKFPPRPEKVG